MVFSAFAYYLNYNYTLFSNKTIYRRYLPAVIIAPHLSEDIFRLARAAFLRHRNIRAANGSAELGVLAVLIPVPGVTSSTANTQAERAIKRALRDIQQGSAVVPTETSDASSMVRDVIRSSL